jgi:hypothetical protein
MEWIYLAVDKDQWHESFSGIVLCPLCASAVDHRVAFVRSWVAQTLAIRLAVCTEADDTPVHVTTATTSVC